MVTLIAQDHPIFRNKRLYVFFFTLKKGLHNGNINDTTPRVFPRTDLANLLDSFLSATPLGLLRQGFLNIKKIFQRCFPLFQKCAGVDQDQGVNFALPNQIRAYHCFTKSCSRGQDTNVMGQKSLSCRYLFLAEFPTKSNADLLSRLTLIR